MCPFMNGLSDCDAQIIELNNISTHRQSNETQITGNFNKDSITEFNIQLRIQSLGQYLLSKTMLI
jgi:hypothetical protein